MRVTVFTVAVLCLCLTACATAVPTAGASDRFEAEARDCSRRGGAMVPVFEGYGARQGYICNGAGGLGYPSLPLREAR